MESSSQSSSRLALETRQFSRLGESAVLFPSDDEDHLKTWYFGVQAVAAAAAAAAPWGEHLRDVHGRSNYEAAKKELRRREEI